MKKSRNKRESNRSNSFLLAALMLGIILGPAVDAGAKDHGKETGPDMTSASARNSAPQNLLEAPGQCGNSPVPTPECVGQLAGPPPAPQKQAHPSKLAGEPLEEETKLPLHDPEEEGPGSAIDMMVKLKDYEAEIQIVHEEALTPVEISMTDLTRIVCSSEISRVVYSKEKGVEIKTEGKEAYIKNQPFERTDPATGKTVIKYDKKPKELYVLCGDRTFSLLLVPRDIPTNTIYLKTTKAAKEEARKFEQASDYENMIFKLVTAVYRENIPDGYRIEEINHNIKDFKEADLIHRRNYNGYALQVREYFLYARTSLQVDETTILDTIKVAGPVAVVIVDSLLDEKQQTRIFVVRVLKDE